jgi:hypothetical protein
MECDICCVGFDQDLHQPKILSQCGHTVCAACIESLRRSSRTIDVQCPHCRASTKPSEIRTNFALINLIGVSDKSPISTGPTCSTHVSNPVILFCVRCGEFICKDCYELASSLHASHERISLEDGVNLTLSDIHLNRSKIESLILSNHEAIQTESIKVQEVSAAVQSMSVKAIQHFNAVTAIMTNELESILGQLHEYQATVACSLNQLETKHRLLSDIANSLPTEQDVSKLIGYLHRRNQIISTLEHEVNPGRVSELLENISLDSSGGRDALGSSKIELPSLRIYDKPPGLLFSLDIPKKRRGSQCSDPDQSFLRPIHRSTSNDKLCR